MEIISIPIDEITPDPNNAKDHPKWQVEQIKNSIEQFGNLDPIGIWGDENLIVEGHGRYEALKELGYHEAECIRLDWLTDEERIAYALAHNKLTMNSGFIPEALDMNLDAIGEIDMSLFGFRAGDWFQDRNRNDDSRQEGNDEYNDFLDKFEQPKTTDDCYTPDIVYDAVADWVTERYGYDRKQMVRPFYPGGDYQNEKYPDGCVVVDNPPFSILSEIRQWYAEHRIKYFLFAPSLSCIGGNKVQDCSITTNASITYENKAKVATSFVTNLEPDYVIMTAPELHEAVQSASDEYAKQFSNPMPKYSYPVNVITAAMGGYLSKYGQELKIRKEDTALIRELDAQKEQGKAIFGGGYLLSEKAAAEKAAAEKAAAEKAAAEKAAATVWKLSDREREIISSLGGDDHDRTGKNHQSNRKNDARMDSTTTANI